MAKKKKNITSRKRSKNKSTSKKSAAKKSTSKSTINKPKKKIKSANKPSSSSDHKKKQPEVSSKKQTKDKNIDINPEKSKRGRKKKITTTEPFNPAIPHKPKYLVKLKIDAKTIIFVKDEKSLKKWKAQYPNAEEIL